MKYTFCLVCLVLCGLVNVGFSVAEGDIPPATLFVNVFFANCFSQGLERDLSWRSIVDFIIFHTSWFVNSDVGSCAANNTDVIDEANCWKNAFGRLLLERSEVLTVAETCVDQFVRVTRAARSGQMKETPEIRFTRRPLLSSDRFARREVFNSRLCPAFENNEIVDGVASAVQEAMIVLPAFDTTLRNFSSVVAFVRKYVKCEEQTCDQCNINYVSEKIYPAFDLRCNRCWQTRLAGVIRNDSVLKAVVTDVAVTLGNNRGPQTPPQFFNIFFANCLMQNLNSSRSWSSTVDFIIHHSSWFENSNVGSCSPQTRNLFDETRCWLIAYGHLISHFSPLLLASRKCAIQIAELTNSSITSVSLQYFISANEYILDLFERYLTESTQVIEDPQARSEILNSRYCTSVTTQEFNDIFMANVMSQGSAGNLLPTDTTLNDFGFVIEQAMSSYQCFTPICDQCTVTFPLFNRRRLRCNRCWPSRLAGMIKDSSPLKQPATDAASSFAR